MKLHVLTNGTPGNSLEFVIEAATNIAKLDTDLSTIVGDDGLWVDRECDAYRGFTPTYHVARIFGRAFAEIVDAAGWVPTTAHPEVARPRTARELCDWLEERLEAADKPPCGSATCSKQHAPGEPCVPMMGRREIEAHSVNRALAPRLRDLMQNEPNVVYRRTAIESRYNQIMAVLDAAQEILDRAGASEPVPDGDWRKARFAAVHADRLRKLEDAMLGRQS